MAPAALTISDLDVKPRRTRITVGVLSSNRTSNFLPPRRISFEGLDSAEQRQSCNLSHPSCLLHPQKNLRMIHEFQRRRLVGCEGVSNVVSGVPILSCSEVMEKFKENMRSYSAMYSSIFGGITTDPAAMLIPLDDHMVHRGHGVFDTAIIVQGCLYELDQHLDRFLRSASMARIKLPFDRAQIRSILVETVSASRCREGSLRYWLSAGPGDFALSPSGCPNSALYAIVFERKSPFSTKPVNVITSSIPMKSPQFSVMKSVNYLQNAHSKMEAEEVGAHAAIWLDEDGYIAEGPNTNVAFVLQDGMLIMPQFDKILSGCTAKRILTLSEKLVEDGILSGAGVGNITVEEGKGAREMMLLDSGVLVTPVVQWDHNIIGDGRGGPVAQALLDLLLEDMTSGPTSVLTPVPY